MLKRFISCSCCYKTGHNIRTCYDPKISETWSYIYHKGNIVTPITGKKNWEEIYIHLTNIVPWRIVIAISVQHFGLKVNKRSNVTNTFRMFHDALYNYWITYWWCDSLQELYNEESKYLQKKKEKWFIKPFLLCLESESELKIQEDCPICLDTFPKMEILTTNCNHTFCKNCVFSHIDHANQHPTCPMCRTCIVTIEIKDVEIYNEW